MAICTPAERRPDQSGKYMRRSDPAIPETTPADEPQNEADRVRHVSSVDLTRF